MSISYLWTLCNEQKGSSPPTLLSKVNEIFVGRHLSFKNPLTNSVQTTYTLLLVPITTKQTLKCQNAGLHDVVIAKKSTTCRYAANNVK